MKRRNFLELTAKASFIGLIALFTPIRLLAKARPYRWRSKIFTNHGTSGDPIRLTKDNILQHIMDCAKVLDEQSVPEEQRWMKIYHNKETKRIEF